MRPSLFYFAPVVTDATSFYRAAGPLNSLRRQSQLDLDIQRVTESNWAVMKECDLLMLQRPFTPNHETIVDMALANGVPVWVDYDDDLFSVPYSNPTYKLYTNERTHKHIANILAKATVVSVSTAELKRKVDPLNKDVRVIPNAYDDFLFYNFRKDHLKGDAKKLVTWRGSRTHEKDILGYLEAMALAAETYPDWTWNFLGEPFWYAVERMKAVKNLPPHAVITTPSLDPIEYFRFLVVTHPGITIVPLWDCSFNRSKSNIAWIEATHAGSVSIVPDWEEWQRPGALTYDDDKSFAERIMSVMRGEQNINELVQASWEYICDNLMLSDVNDLRESLIMDLLDSKP